ncbi:MAG: type I methionyl aminopeptidase [Chloroflexi bacterium]|nr:type I methionyl aminopeptidase [Chloroflexota bacterium]
MNTLGKSSGAYTAQKNSGILIKSPREIKIMRSAGQVVALAIEALKEAVRPGVRTIELDAVAFEVITKNGAIPSFKGYRGYPASICASINEEIVHGIPGERRLKEGDIVSLDVGAIVDGFHGDAAATLGVGEISPEAQRLIDTTRDALWAGIKAAKKGGRLGDISATIQKYVEERSFSVVREYVGHGIGRNLHEDPSVPNYGEAGQGPLLRTGMTLALEPMVNAGGWQTKLLSDNWTVVTADGSLSAHFEHTIVIGDGGAEILTLP